MNFMAIRRSARKLDRISIAVRSISAPIFVAAFFSSPPSIGAEVKHAERLVTDYLRLAETNPGKARDLLVPDASVMVFDLVGSMEEAFPEYVVELRKLGCSRSSLRHAEQIDKERGVDEDVVKVVWDCPVEMHTGEKKAVVRFIVVKQKIAAAILEDRWSERHMPNDAAGGPLR